MHKDRRIIADTFCDVYQLLKSWIDESFWDLNVHDYRSNAIYIIGRQQLVENIDKVKHLCNQGHVVVFANSAEGSTTQIAQLKSLGIDDLVKSGSLLLLSGGRLPQCYPYLLHEHFLVRILEYDENVDAMQRTREIFDTRIKPYTFLFLNGRSRPHRKYLWHRFQRLGLLDQSLWTMLDGRGSGSRLLSLWDGQHEYMSDITPIQVLPKRYEIPRYHGFEPPNLEYANQFVKADIFNQEWGEIYLHADAYIHTYFSVVTETVLESHDSFFTEKIAKPLAMGHPWIAASNPGFYRDLRNLGFRTFHGIIDESFDLIDDHQTRMDRVVGTVQDICQSNLQEFLRACKDVCIYNQQHLHDVVKQENHTFPQRFFTFLDQHERS